MPVTPEWDKRVSYRYLVSLKEPLNEKVIDKMKDSGYHTISELVRELLRRWVKEA